MAGLKTSYEFTLPRGYVDSSGQVHRAGVMRLATARDELDPLRDPTVKGPDDPRLTILVLARVVERLGDIEFVTPPIIEELFAADLAYLQDFYGVINFGSQEEYEALIRSQQETTLVGADGPSAPRTEGDSIEPTTQLPPRPTVRTAVEELARQTE